MVAEVEDAAATAVGGGWRRLPVMSEKKKTAYHRRWPPRGRGPGRLCKPPVCKGEEARWRRWACARCAGELEGLSRV